MKKLLLFLLAVAQVLLMASCSEIKKINSEDMVYFENGIIYTANANDDIVEALAFRDGKIIFVGTAADGAQYKRKAAQIIDLKGKMLMPGMIDGHIHSTMPEFFDVDVTQATTVDKMLHAVKECVNKNKNAQTLYGFGYYPSLFEGEELINGPRKERLDEICPDKPIAILSFDGHAMWLNSKALDYCGITKNTQSPAGGEIIKDESGELWGILTDAAIALAREYPMNSQRIESNLKEYVSALNALGYTSIMTLPGNGYTPVPWELYQKMDANQLLTLRVRGAGIVTSWQTEKDMRNLKSLADTYQSDNLKVIAAKFFLDGVVDNRSAYLLEPYTGNTDTSGEPCWEPDALNHAVTEVNRMGLLSHMHTIGDAAVKMGLDAVEYSENQLGKSSFRNALTHLQLVDPPDFARFNRLGAIAVANPYWHYKAASYWEPVEYAAIGARAEKEYPLKSFLDHSATLVFASDYPVTTIPNPFDAIRAGVTRNLISPEINQVKDITDPDDPPYLLWPEERLTVKQLLRGFTIDAAYAIFEEHTTGSLEVGKSADMIMIDRDLFHTPPLSINEANVLRTYFKGQLVYKK